MPSCNVTLTLNGITQSLSINKQASLLTVLRNDFELNSPKYGCGLGECGACTVLVDGIAARACVIPAWDVADRRITTLEGLGTLGNLLPIQQAFIDEPAAQCGYCLSGMIMMTAALLARNPDPTQADIHRELSGNLCRCGVHLEIVKAVQRAAVLMRPAA